MSNDLALPAPARTGREIPGDAGWPLLGYGPAYIRDPLALWRARYERHGPVSWFNAFGTRCVTALGPDACEPVLANRDKAYSNGGGWSPLIGPFFERGLMLLDGGEHLAHRRLMQQAFTAERLARYADALNPAVAEGIAGWSTGSAFPAYRAVKQLTLDLATGIFMGGAEGAPRGQIDSMNRAFVDCVQAATSIVRYPVPGGRWHRGLVGRRRLEAFLRTYLPARRSGSGDDLFSVLCQVEEDGERFSDDDVINHMIFLLMAAHDTSTITISTMMRYLGQHPDWQQRCRDESLALGTRAPSHADLDGLVSLDLVLKECLRLVAPVPAMARLALHDTQILGHDVPAGTMVSVTPHYTHHLAEYWPDPERFDPERFAEPRREDRSHRYAWVPFGGGVHKCLGLYFSGMEIKIVLHHLLLAFDWAVPADYRTPMNYASLPFPKDAQPVELRARLSPA